MKRLLSLVAFFATLQASAQQVNPVPDYVFRNQMSVGRNAVTDTAAYFSIGPRYGATKGFMPPIVGDTATFSSGKRNGLLIFSVQKNKFLYWDSVRVQWSDMAGSSGSYIVAGDTSAMLAPYLRKADTTAMLTNYVRHAGFGLTKSAQSFLVDTLNISTRAWRQKGIDSVAGLSRIGGSGTTNYVPKFTASSTIGNSNIFDFNNKIGIGTTSPNTDLHVYKSGGPAYIALTGGSSNNQGAAFVIYKSNNSFTLLDIGDKAAIVGGAPDTAAAFRAGSGVPLVFEPNAAEALRLNTNQTITATSLAGSGSRIVVADATGTLSASSALSGYVSGSGTTNYVPKFTAASTIGNSQIFDDGTSVGVGTTSPNIYSSGAHKYLTVSNTAASSYSIATIAGGAGGGGELDFGNQTIKHAAIASLDGSILGFYTNNTNSGTGVTERLRITSGGNVGIGTQTPANNGTGETGVEIRGANYPMLTISTPTISQFQGVGLTSGYTGTSTNHPFAILSNGTTRQYIHANGRIGVNTTTDAGYQLDINGTLRSVNGANFATTSGSVGIGTASPAAKADITGTLRIGAASFVAPTSGAGMEFSYRTSDSTGYLTTYSRDYSGYRNQAFYALSQKFAYGTGGSIGIFLTSSGETLFNTETDAGNYTVQVSGNIYNTGSITTGAPSGGSIKPWKIGEAATVSPTSPNRTIRVEIDGTVYYLHAKTTND